MPKSEPVFDPGGGTEALKLPSTVEDHLYSGVPVGSKTKCWSETDSVNAGLDKLQLEQPEKKKQIEIDEGLKTDRFEDEMARLKVMMEDDSGDSKVWDEHCSPGQLKPQELGVTVSVTSPSLTSSEDNVNVSDVNNVVAKENKIAVEVPASKSPEVLASATANQKELSQPEIQNSISETQEQMDTIENQDDLYTADCSVSTVTTNNNYMQSMNQYSGDFLQEEENPDIYLADTVLIGDRSVPEMEYNQVVQKVIHKHSSIANIAENNKALILSALANLPKEATVQNLDTLHRIDAILDELVKEDSISEADRHWLLEYKAQKVSPSFTQLVQFDKQVSMCDELSKRPVQATDGYHMTGYVPSNNFTVTVEGKKKKTWSKKQGQHKEECERKIRRMRVTKVKALSSKQIHRQEEERGHHVVDEFKSIQPMLERGPFAPAQTIGEGQICYTDIGRFKEFLCCLESSQKTFFQRGAFLHSAFAGPLAFEEGVHYELVDEKWNKKGGFGVTNICCLKNDPSFVFIIKKIKKVKGNEKVNFNKLEVLVPLDCKDDNIVQIYGFIDRPDEYQIIMEFAGIPLDDYVKQKGQLSDREISEIFGQMLNGVTYLHGKHYFHRDIKPQNVTVREFPNGTLKVTLIDFGACISIGTEPNLREMTPMYLPAEMCRLLLGINISQVSYEKIDGHALGCTLAYLCSGRHIWQDVAFANNKKMTGQQLLQYIAKNPTEIQEKINNLCGHNSTFHTIASYLCDPDVEYRLSPIQLTGKVKQLNGMMYLDEDSLFHSIHSSGAADDHDIEMIDESQEVGGAFPAFDDLLIAAASDSESANQIESYESDYNDNDYESDDSEDISDFGGCGDSSCDCVLHRR